MDETAARALECSEESFIAASGPGGQNVNKVATAVQLRLDVFALRLEPAVFHRLKTLAGNRMTARGEIVITARRFRTQEANREDARARLAELIEQAQVEPRKRAKSRVNRVGRHSFSMGFVAGFSATGRLKRSDFGKITIGMEHTIVELPADLPEAVFDALSGTRISGRKIDIQPDTGRPGGDRKRPPSKSYAKGSGKTYDKPKYDKSTSSDAKDRKPRHKKG